MIDIHSHLLPGIDDGAKEVEVSLEMAKQYVEEGFKKVIATPHWIEHSKIGQVDKTSVALEKLRAIFAEKGIPLELSLGNEFFITPNLSKSLKEAVGSSLAGSRYVLVEFPMNEYPLYTDHALHELQLKGYIPVIAHPERYHYVMKDPNLVLEWIRRGMLIQVNLPSVAKLYGSGVQDTARILLEHGMVHFLATDSHSYGKRSPKIMEAVQKSGIVSQEEIDLYLNKNSEYILKDMPFEIEEPREYKKKKKWFFF